MGEEQRREPRDPLRVLDRHALRLWAVRSRAALAERREEILSMIWDMEEEIMGRAPGQAESP